MKKMIIVFVCAVVFAFGCRRSEDTLTQGNTASLEGQIQETVKPPSPWPVLEPHPTDPSREPMISDGVFFSQWRVIADFDGNGMLDIGVSEGEPADCTLVLYLRMSDGYEEAGDLALIAGEPLSIEHVNPPVFSRLWSSWHSSDGNLISFIELKSGLIVTNSRLSNRFELLGEMPEGWENKNKLPDALHAAIFKNSSTPIWWEKSVYTNGVFEWVPIRE
jgi:hypothetical protein